MDLYVHFKSKCYQEAMIDIWLIETYLCVSHELWIWDQSISVLCTDKKKRLGEGLEAHPHKLIQPVTVVQEAPGQTSCGNQACYQRCALCFFKVKPVSLSQQSNFRKSQEHAPGQLMQCGYLESFLLVVLTICPKQRPHAWYAVTNTDSLESLKAITALRKGLEIFPVFLNPATNCVRYIQPNPAQYHIIIYEKQPPSKGQDTWNTK